jgi:hypothetical protein
VTRLANSRAVRRILIPAASFAFLAGLQLSAGIYYSGKKLDLRRAAISNLARPADNPNGYLAAGAGITLCGLLLVPVGIWFFRVLRTRHSGAATVGLIFFVLGLTGAVFFGLMSPFEAAYSDVHIYIAYATFTFFTAGLVIWFVIATWARVRAGRGRWLAVALAIQAFVAILLLWVTVGMIFPHGINFFNDRTFSHSIALCEWVLCSGNMASLFLLAAAVEQLAKAT